MSAFIVAEAGVNHLGARAKMLAFCDAAKACGADAVKFQAFDAWKLAQRRGWNDREQIKHEHLETFKLLQRAELSDADLDAIAAHCKAIGFKWFASVFDPSQVERVLSRGACALKIGHKEADDDDLSKACHDAKEKLGRYNGRYRGDRPSDSPYAWWSADWKLPLWISGGNIHGIWEYPAKSPPRFGEIGGAAFWGGGGALGFSSHYADWHIPALSVLCCAEYIEAHLRLSDDDPEAAWSLSVEDFGKMVKQIREFESWL